MLKLTPHPTWRWATVPSVVVRSFVLAATLFVSSDLWAANACYASAALAYHVDPLLLHAIAIVESGHQDGRVNTNRDGSKDWGPLQVNDRNLTPADRLRWQRDPCYRIDKGASVLAQMIDRFGYSWKAVGAYNAGGSPAREKTRGRYAKKVWAIYQVLVSRRMQLSRLRSNRSSVGTETRAATEKSIQ